MSEADQLERDLEQDREHLRETLGALEDKMSPGRLIDEVMTHFNTGPKAFATDLTTQIRENPMPALLTGVGVAWLMMSRGKPAGSGTTAAEPPADPFGVTTDPGDFDAWHEHDRLQQAEWACVRLEDEAADAYSRRLDQARAAALGVLHDPQEDHIAFAARVREAADSVKHKGTSARQKLKQAAASSKHKAGSAMNAGADRVQSAAASAKSSADAAISSARRLPETNPVATAALGVALGALFGAGAPLTRSEERAFGAVADRALAAGADLSRKASEAVSEGLTPQDATEPAGPAPSGV